MIGRMEDNSSMAFRERRAWLMVATQVVAYLPYFTLAPVTVPVVSDPHGMIRGLIWFAAASLAHALMYLTGLAVLARATPVADRANPDERDRAIDCRAARTGYYVLMVGAIVVGIVMPFSYRGWPIVNATLFAIVLAEGISQVSIIRSYRGGWHG